MRISRRTFACLLPALALALPATAVAQRSATVVRRIGVLESGAPDTPAELESTSRALRDLGWDEGRNLQVERRYANGHAEKLQPLADELVRANVELIVTGGTAATLAAMRATSTIPIVFRAAGDAVRLGIVASLARPGGNVTGYSLASPEVAAKYLVVLKELLPGLRRIGVLENVRNPYFRAARDAYEDACRSLGIQPVFAEISTADDIPDAIGELARRHVDVLVVRGDGLLESRRGDITARASKLRLPVLAEQVEFVAAGALISYGPLQSEEDRRRAGFIDRILRGAKPADLPVEQPTQFRLSLNLKTAAALGIAIPPPLLVRADDVVR